MAVEAQTITNPETPNTNGAPPPAAAPPVSPAPPVAAQTIPTERVPTRKLIESDDGDIPDDADVLEFRPKTFKSRLERHANSVMTKRLSEHGVASMDEVGEKLAKLKEIEAREEEQRLAQLSEVERMREENAKLLRERDEALTTHQRYVLAQETREVDQEVREIAAKYITPKFSKLVSRELQEHLQGVSEAAYGDDPAGYVAKWFAEYAERNPELAAKAVAEAKDAADAASASAEQAKTNRQRVLITPIGNGGHIAAPVNGSAQPPPNPGGTRTAAPNQANSMSDKEWREYKKQQGWT